MPTGDVSFLEFAKCFRFVPMESIHVFFNLFPQTINFPCYCNSDHLWQCNFLLDLHCLENHYNYCIYVLYCFSDGIDHKCIDIFCGSL